MRLKDFLSVVHSTTEVVNIYVVAGSLGDLPEEYDKYNHDFTLCEDVFERHGKSEKYENYREQYHELVKLYGDVPVWNLTADMQKDYLCRYVEATLNVRCHFRDIAEIYVNKKKTDKRKKSREYMREYRKRKAKDV